LNRQTVAIAYCRMLMNENAEVQPESGSECVPTSPARANEQKSPRFFDSTDRLCFYLCAVLVFGVYLFTLAPEVTLEWSGIFATGAKYGGISAPPGYPLWSLYGWLFTVLLPFSNIAWRTAVASATAGALTCGFVALLVSRLGADMLDGIGGFDAIDGGDRKRIRVVCGCVAGGAIGFAGTFWQYAIVPGPWPLTLMLFSAVLCLLIKWNYKSDRMCPIYWAAFLYGATLTTSQSLAVAMLGLEFFILLTDHELGRDIFFANTVFLTTVLVLERLGQIEAIDAYVRPVRSLYVVIAGGSLVITAVMVLRTRRFLSRWRSLLGLALSFLSGAAIYFFIPVTSMTNPPVNWGYPRVVEGFYHVLTCGQFERIAPNYSVRQLIGSVIMYFRLTIYHFGSLYLFPALVPFFFIHKMRSPQRSCMFGLGAVFLCLTLLMLILLNPPSEFSPHNDLSGICFSPSHLVVAIWSGLGLSLSAALLARRVSRQQPAG
jgi:hypothetical protein